MGLANAPSSRLRLFRCERHDRLRRRQGWRGRRFERGFRDFLGDGGETTPTIDAVTVVTVHVLGPTGAGLNGATHAAGPQIVAKTMDHLRLGPDDPMKMVQMICKHKR